MDIAQGEVLFSLPLTSILSLFTSDVSTKLPQLKSLPDWLGLAAALLYEDGQGKSSQWHSYMCILPHDFNTLIYWTEEEIQELQASAVTGKIGKAEAESQFALNLIPLLRSHSELFPNHAVLIEDCEKEAALYQILHRMATIVASYSFDLTDHSTLQENLSEDDDGSDEDDIPSLKAMVPFADLLNADDDRRNVSIPVLSEDALHSSHKQRPPV